MSFLQRYRDPLIVLLLLAVPLVFYISNSKEPRDYNPLDQVIVWISSPVQWVVTGSVEGISEAWSGYIALVGVEEENTELRRKVARLEADSARLREQALENQRLKLLLDLKERSPRVEPVTARIMATSPTPLFRSIRIARGTQHGVQVGAAVVNHDGVVGRIAAAGEDWADVMLLVDNNSSTDVLVQRTRARARVRGMGRDQVAQVKVEYLSRTENIEPGDVLITSGLGSVFPKGLRVGKVISVEKRAFGLYQEAIVRPSVDFQRLEEVMVIREGWPRDANYEKGLGLEPDASPEPEGEELEAPRAEESSLRGVARTSPEEATSGGPGNE